MGLTPPRSRCSSVFPKSLDILDVAEPSQTQEFPHGIHTVLWEELIPAALAALSHSSPTTAPKAPAGSENPQFFHLDHPAQPRKTGILWDGSFQNVPQPPWLMVLNPAGTKYPQKGFSWSGKTFPWSCQCHIRSGAAAPGLLHTNPKIQERLWSAQEFPTSASASGTARERKPSSRVNPRAKSLPKSLEKRIQRGLGGGRSSPSRVSCWQWPAAPTAAPSGDGSSGIAAPNGTGPADPPGFLPKKPPKNGRITKIRIVGAVPAFPGYS